MGGEPDAERRYLTGRFKDNPRMRRTLKKYLPDPEAIRRNPWLRPFAGSLLHFAGASWAAVGAVMGLGLLVKAAALAFGLGAIALSRLGARGPAA